MALNRKKPSVEIPAPSSSSEAEDSSSSSEEEQQEQMTRTTPTLKPQQQEDIEDEDDDEEEESDEPEKGAATVTPSSKKPQSESSSEEDDEESDSEDDGKAIKLSSVSDFAVKVNKSPEPSTVLTKRVAENDAGSSQNNKKAKVVSDGDGKIAGSAVDDSKKKSVVNRVWSENNEILLLEGFHSFITKNGSDSITNISAFHDTLEELDLSLDVTRTRLYEKLRGLKNKYLNNVRREHTVFSKPHEEKLYKISEKIWGGEVGVIEESGSKKSKKADKRSVEKKDICKMEEPGSSFPLLAASLEFEASTYLSSIDSKEFTKNMVLKFNKKKAKELEDEWNEYSLMEYELYAKRVKIISKQVDAALNVLKQYSNLN